MVVAQELTSAFTCPMTTEWFALVRVVRAPEHISCWRDYSAASRAVCLETMARTLDWHIGTARAQLVARSGAA